MAKGSGRDVDLSSFSRRNRKQNWKLIVGNIALSVVLVISSLALGGMTLLNSRFFDHGESEIPGLEDIKKGDNENVTYFLVAGLDLSENLTDIIMVVCFDHLRGTANILQIPRDTFVGSDVPTGKINAVYGHARKGEVKINALIRKINSAFGLPVDHYVTIDIPGFRELVDALGGVEVNMPKKLTVEDSVHKKNIVIGPGKVTLNGIQAEGFVRHRKSYVKGDMGRVEAQRLFYAGFIKKLMGMSLSQMTKVAAACYDNIGTDMTNGQILSYAQLAQKMDLEDIRIEAMPGHSDYAIPEGLHQRLSYYSMHKQQYVDLINRYFLPYEKYELLPSDLDIVELFEPNEWTDIDEGGSIDTIGEDDK